MPTQHSSRTVFSAFSFRSTAWCEGNDPCAADGTCRTVLHPWTPTVVYGTITLLSERADPVELYELVSTIVYIYPTLELMMEISLLSKQS